MNADFWHSPDTHILINPHRPDDALGLQDFVEHTRGKHGWLLFQTSGSESAPKWVLLSKAAMLISAEAVNAHLEATARDRWLIALPTHHVGGFAIHARAFASGSVVHELVGKWDAKRFAEACNEHHITLTSLVPTQVFDLVQSRIAAPPSLRAIVVGGGALAHDIGIQVQALGWPVLQSYGMTEACSQIATEPLHHLHSGFEPDGLEVLPHWDLSVDDEGRLVLKGEALAAGYVERMQSDECIHHSAFIIHHFPSLTTRDRVTLWQHGTRRFLRFLGRDSQVLKINGELVHLQPLQARLDAACLALNLPAGTAVLTPLPHARQGTTLVLVHGTDALPDASHLLAAYNASAAPLERALEAIALPALPRSPLGKIALPEVQRILAAVGGERI